MTRRTMAVRDGTSTPSSANTGSLLAPLGRCFTIWDKNGAGETMKASMRPRATGGPCQAKRALLGRKRELRRCSWNRLLTPGPPWTPSFPWARVVSAFCLDRCCDVGQRVQIRSVKGRNDMGRTVHRHADAATGRTRCNVDTSRFLLWRRHLHEHATTTANEISWHARRRNHKGSHSRQTIRAQSEPNNVQLC